VPALHPRRRHRRARPAAPGGRATRRLTLSDAELVVVAEALREATGADLLTPGSRAVAREPVDRYDAMLPSATDQQPAGPATGRLLAGDEILRMLLDREDDHGGAALGNAAIADALSRKPAGTSVRELLEDLRRGGWLLARGAGPERRFELARKGRGRAPALQRAAPDPTTKAASASPTSCWISSQAVRRAARAQRGRLHLPALRRALDGLPRAHRPRRGIRAAY
jgi:hypothetical protein